MPRTPPSLSTRPPPRSARGTVLVVALIFMALLALGLTSYLNLNLQNTRLAHRSYQQNAGFHLAEAGAEEALWSFNRAQAGEAGAWAGWTARGAAALRRIDGFDFGANLAGSVKVYVTTTNPARGVRPVVVAESVLRAPNQPPVSRLIEVTLSRRSYFSQGLVAKERIIFSGSVSSVDSWNSDPDNDPATPPVPYSAGVRNDRGSVATASVENTAALVNHASIWGTVATGGGVPQVGSNGSIRGADSPPGVRIDPARVTTDFTADFPVITAPVEGTVLAGVGATLGTAGAATRWRTPGIVLRGNDTLTILGDVTLVLMAGTGTQALSMTGNAQLIIPEGSSLTLYAEGDIQIAGNGLLNANARPGTFRLWGTNTSLAGQSIDLAGNGALKAAVYAPNATVKINGNGDMMGSLVAREIRFTGNAAFHYDESLAVEEADAPFGVVRWRELTSAAERAAWSTQLAGW